MRRLKRLDALLGGILVLGCADLLWLNGWLVPAALNAENNHAADAQIESQAPQQVAQTHPPPVRPIAYSDAVVDPAPTVALEADVQPNATVEPAGLQTADTAESPVLNIKVLFGSNADLVADRDMERLRRASLAIIDSELEITVIGHADERGSLEYNDGLALRRAEKVSELLQGFGVPRRLIRTETLGEREPIAHASYQRQRRVEIRSK